MSQEEKLNEVIALLQELNEVKKNYSEIHKVEHEYLRVLIEEHKIAKETRLIILRKLTAGTLWAFAVGLGSAAVFGLKSWLSSSI